ncbi:MAG: hypothetical protein DHS20C13_27350 [Thermodesulfobacteriota bacterium]|nr:MAG: hypothetical protein DHS20C13_27350 [Thermodesulfobacteriota bacterium]
MGGIRYLTTSPQVSDHSMDGPMPKAYEELPNRDAMFRKCIETVERLHREYKYTDLPIGDWASCKKEWDTFIASYTARRPRSVATTLPTMRRSKQIEEVTVHITTMYIASHLFTDAIVETEFQHHPPPPLPG